eukprot:CAMPEP_0171384396 /NCGR_PEP_ID=MMETSP0879-20121228/38444_1 /TAXON_ID=67004 /ORGANISM="Thalassiosira weissflogii, Strain CCMP1336" /LENGTH=866 /DNA_ID=CAMNT_0011896667 /DNA_START=2227 /DNA_END=4829 /DNA_ORIENTATION=-
MSTTEAQDPVKSETNKVESVIRSRKERPTGSTHFGDADWDEEQVDEIGDATWGEVAKACCVHDAKEWGKIFVGACGALFFLYFFLFALELLGNSAKVLGGCRAGGLLSDETNPVAGLVIGELATALIQSSSTTTSIIVSLVGADAVSVNSGIYLVMGANIGTSVTNTIVSMGQMADGAQLERAFAGATVHDLFNLLSVAILFPLEIISHYLYHLTNAMLPDSVGDGEKWEGPIKKIVSPFAGRVLKSNKDVIKDIATGKVDSCDAYYPVLCLDGIEDYKHCASKCDKDVGEEVGVDCGRVGLITCDKDSGECPGFFQNGASLNDDYISGGVCLVLSLFLLFVCLMALVNVLQDYKHCASKCDKDAGEEVGVDCGRVGLITCDKASGECPGFFQNGASLHDDYISGGVCLVLSLFLLFVCLMALVNVLQRGLAGMSTRIIYKATNVNGLIAMAIGTGITILVQSSSITTSVLTPFVGLGVIQLEQMLPLTLGANIGTTIGLQALASKCDKDAGEEVGVDCGRVGLITCDKKTGCPAFFQNGANLHDDSISGGVCLVLSLFLLIVCLMGLVNVLQRGLAGMSTRIIYKATNVNGLIGIVIGAAITILVQSSSITTSVLTPFVGLGVIQLEQMLPLTLGANIGTTITGLLAAMVSDNVDALQVALCHLFFNISGIVIWYPIPIMRRVPLRGARALGRATRRSRLVPPIYIIVVFFVIPLLLLGLSSLFMQKTVGFTVLGSFLVIGVVLGIARFIWWWKKQEGLQKCLACLDRRTDMNSGFGHCPFHLVVEEEEGLQKCLACLDRRTDMNNTMKTLPEDMQFLKSKVSLLAEHTGLPEDEEAGDAQKGSDGTAEEVAPENEEVAIEDKEE